MGVLHLLILSGLGGSSWTLAPQYIFVYQWTTWAYAQQYCSDMGADMVIVRNVDEMNQLRNVMGAQDNSNYWLGLKQGTKLQWQWSFWNSSGPPSYTNWKTGWPGSFGDCVAMSSQGPWINEDCAQATNFVCHNVRNLSQNVYVPVFTPMPWSQARQYCRSNYTDLATIPSSTAQQEMFSLTPAMAYWIGLFRDAWEWANGDQSTFRQWATVPPSNVSVEACAAVDMNGLWHSLSCSSYLPFICQMGKEEKSSVMHVRVSFIGKMDPNVIQTAILNQIRAKLTANGMANTTILQWNMKPGGGAFGTSN